MYKNFFKHILDFIISLTGFIVLSPVFIIIYILLLFANQGKAFFIQTRPGKNGKLFDIIKFKTMNDKRDADGNLLPDNKRITSVGELLRKTSLDEIPQLINVIKGDMSLVGPRPLLPEYMKLYTEEQLKRHNVKPGITGWAQVNGRNALSWQDKFAHDVWYVKHISFLLDIKIILLTIKKVFISEGINSSTATTMDKFMGNN